jgi:HK97 family phage major capsid protein
MKRYNLARALLHSKDLNCPEAEQNFAIRKSEEDFRTKHNIGNVDRAWKNSITAPFSSLLTRDLNVNASSNAALTVSTSIPEIQQALRPTSLIMKLPIQVIPAEGVFVLPRLSTGTSATPLSELQVLSSADPSFGATGAGPARLSVQVTLSKQLLAQAAGSESLNDVLKRDLARAISQNLDNQIINGNGVAGTVTGIANLASTLTPFTFGAAATWSAYVGAQKQLETNFLDASSSYYLIGPATAAKARQALRGTSTGLFILEDDHISNIPVYVSSFSGVSEQVIVGDWQQVVVGIWGGGFDFTVDFYSKAGSGEVVVTCLLYFNVYVRRPQALVVSTDSGAQ